MKNKKALPNKNCVVCSSPLKIYNVYTRSKTLVEMYGACVPCANKKRKAFLATQKKKEF
jgi:hypothetical protein